MSIQKHRYWWFILYPESAVSDWQQKIKDRCLPAAVSPLHEFDLYETGELKKPHHHIILAYSGPTTFNSVKALTVDELQATIPKPLDNVKKAFEYLTHKNDLDKFQYSEDDIQLLNAFDITEMIQLSERDAAELDISIIADVNKNDIKEYSELIDYYITESDYIKFNRVASHTLFFNRYITSRRHSSAKSDEEYIKEFNERR